MRKLMHLQKSLGKISFTADVWTDTNRKPFMGVTAHWIEAQPQAQKNAQRPQLALRADLVGFVHIPGRHTGGHLAHAFLHVLDRINITEKVYFLSFL